MSILYLDFINYESLFYNLNINYICSIKFKQHLKN